MAKIKVKLFNIDGNYHSKIDSIKYCCNGFEKHYENNLQIGYIYDDDIPVPFVGIIDNIGIHQDYDYVMDWELDDEVLQLGEPELKYDLSVINYCPYCGERIDIEVSKEVIPEEANNLIEFLNAKDKDRKKIKIVSKEGKPLTINDAYSYLAEIVGKIFDDAYSSEIVNVLKDEIIKY